MKNKKFLKKKVFDDFFLFNKKFFFDDFFTIFDFDGEF